MKKIELTVTFTRSQAAVIEEAATAARCTPEELVAALSLGQLELIHNSIGEDNRGFVAECLAGYVDGGQAPRFHPDAFKQSV